MSSFAETLDEFKINYYPIETLSYFIKDSVYFTNWQEVCPDETVFPISTKIDIN